MGGFPFCNWRNMIIPVSESLLTFDRAHRARNNLRLERPMFFIAVTRYAINILLNPRYETVYVLTRALFAALSPICANACCNSK